MKKNIIIPTICVILLCGIVSGVALSGIIDKPKLSSFSDKALYTVLRIYGLSIPDELSEETKKNLINGELREIVECVENEPDIYLAFSYTVMADFYEGVQNAVNKYYGAEKTPKLSEMDEDNAMRLLARQGVSIPEYIQWEGIREMIAYLEESPDAPGAYSNPATQELFDALQEIVKEYY